MKFWRDGNGVVKFPNLYALSKAKEACVADLWEQRERERGGDFA